MNYSCGRYIDVTLSQKQTMTAYEELKAWCEKHLEPDEYMASNSRIISINSTDFYFDTDGSLSFID